MTALVWVGVTLALLLVVTLVASPVHAIAALVGGVATGLIYAGAKGAKR